jgi:hypothetical protein
MCNLIFHVKQADARVAGVGDLRLGVNPFLDREFHIGLSRRHPNITHHHIFQRDAIVPMDGEFKRTTGFDRRQNVTATDSPSAAFPHT